MLGNTIGIKSATGSPPEIQSQSEPRRFGFTAEMKGHVFTSRNCHTPSLIASRLANGQIYITNHGDLITYRTTGNKGRLVGLVAAAIRQGAGIGDLIDIEIQPDDYRINLQVQKRNGIDAQHDADSLTSANIDEENQTQGLWLTCVLQKLRMTRFQFALAIGESERRIANYLANSTSNDFRRINRKIHQQIVALINMQCPQYASALKSPWQRANTEFKLIGKSRRDGINWIAACLWLHEQPKRSASITELKKVAKSLCPPGTSGDDALALLFSSYGGRYLQKSHSLVTISAAFSNTKEYRLHASP